MIGSPRLKCSVREIEENMSPALTPLRIAILTVSDSRTPETDKSGDAISDALLQAGHQVVGRTILADDRDRLEAQFRVLMERDEVQVVIATGGTGVTLRDVTPEALEPLVSKWIPGFGELFRYYSLADVGVSTIQSRACGAVCQSTLMFLLPGSTGAVRLAMDKILLPQLDSRTRPCNFAELLPRIREEAPPAG